MLSRYKHPLHAHWKLILNYVYLLLEWATSCLSRAWSGDVLIPRGSSVASISVRGRSRTICCQSGYLKTRPYADSHEGACSVEPVKLLHTLLHQQSSVHSLGVHLRKERGTPVKHSEGYYNNNTVTPGGSSACDLVKDAERFKKIL